MNNRTRIVLTLIALAMAILGLASTSADAGVITYVKITGDADCGISTDHTYTHKLDFGTGTPGALINGVQFDAYNAAANGTLNFNRTASSGTLNDHAGNTGHNVSGGLADLLTDMYYNGNNTVGGTTTWTLSGLTAGQTYHTRIYTRQWGANNQRTVTFVFDPDGPGPVSDATQTINEDDATTVGMPKDNDAYYINYEFTAVAGQNLVITLTQNLSNQSWHLYGLSNQLYSPATATAPYPGDKATDVSFETDLGWSSGMYAVKHNVYFGTSFDEVDTGSADVLVAEGLTVNTFAPGRLEYGQTYYWRVDEVNAAPHNTVFKGAVWSFTVEPFSYALAAANITATASSRGSVDTAASKTIDGSGLKDDLHSTTNTDMWVSLTVDANPWIQYEFDRAYRLDKMLVWNSNLPVETTVGYGVKDVTILTSLDGENWTTLGDFQFEQAAGSTDYAANTTVDFAGAAAKYVKLAITSNWSPFGLKTYSLSEVRFFQVPTYPSEPSPVTGASAQEPAVTLRWKTGREAGSHQVYLGTDVNDMALVDTVAENACDVELALGQTYYWKVVEVNEAETPSTWEGPVWSFTTDDSILVEGFEAYDDDIDGGTTIFQTWLDGYEEAANGSIVGYNDAPFAQQAVVLGGKQSMPFAYDNTTATYSEAVRTFDEAQDWTGFVERPHGLGIGRDVANVGAGQLYVKINGTQVLYGGASADLLIGVWQPWTIDLAATGVNLKKVKTLAIGVKGTGSSGSLLFDEIRLYPTAASTVTPVDPGTTGLVAWYKFDGDAKDSAGSHHGTATGSPGFVAGKVGQALNMTADAQYVAVAYAADLAMSTFTVAAWVNVSDLDAMRAILGTRIGGDNTFDLKVEAARIHGDIGDGSVWLNTSLDITAARGGVIGIGEWHHIAYVIDNASQTCYMYLDGALGATASFTGTPMLMKSGQTLGIGYCSSGEYMHGQLDEVRLYNRALSVAEVAGLVGRTGAICVAP